MNNGFSPQNHPCCPLPADASRQFLRHFARGSPVSGFLQCQLSLTEFLILHFQLDLVDSQIVNQLVHVLGRQMPYVRGTASLLGQSSLCTLSQLGELSLRTTTLLHDMPRSVTSSMDRIITRSESTSPSMRRAFRSILRTPMPSKSCSTRKSSISCWSRRTFSNSSLSEGMSH